MKRLLLIIPVFSGLGCSKTQVNQNESVDIIYEMQTNVTGFAQIKYGKFFSVGGFTGIAMQDWTVAGTGTFTHTESIRKGFVAEVYAIHPSSNDWSLKIRSASGAVLQTGTVDFIIDSNYYMSTVSVAVH